MEPHGMQEYLKQIHAEEDAEDREHVAKTGDEEVDSCSNVWHANHTFFAPDHRLQLGEENLQENFTELAVGKWQGPQT